MQNIKMEAVVTFKMFFVLLHLCSSQVTSSATTKVFNNYKAAVETTTTTKTATTTISPNATTEAWMSTSGNVNN